MFFTAMALVAFTGASMTNTKEVKKARPVTKKTVSLEERTYCDQMWISLYVHYIENLHPGSAGSKEAWDYADSNAADRGCI